MLQAELIIPDHVECWLLQNTTCPRKHTKGAEVGPIVALEACFSISWCASFYYASSELGDE